MSTLPSSSACKPSYSEVQSFDTASRCPVDAFTVDPEFDVEPSGDVGATIIPLLKQSRLVNCAETRKKASRYGYDYWAMRKESRSSYHWVPLEVKLSDGAVSEIHWSSTLSHPPLFAPWSGYFWQRSGHIRGQEVAIGPKGGWVSYKKLCDSDEASTGWVHDFDPDAILTTYIHDCDQSVDRGIAEQEADTNHSQANPINLEVGAIEIKTYVLPPVDPNKLRCSLISKEERIRELLPNWRAESDSDGPCAKRSKVDRLEDENHDIKSDDSEIASDSESDLGECEEGSSGCSSERSQSESRSDTLRKKKLANRPLKPRASGIVRSSKPSCLPRCISESSHDEDWPGKAQDQAVFNAFLKECCNVKDRMATCYGKAIQDEYALFCLGHPNLKKLSSKSLGRCCAAAFCKTNSGNKALYHGLSIVPVTSKKRSSV